MTSTDDAHDDLNPRRGNELAPVVGIGASAGGIAPLLEFFRAMPADSGMVFVVVVHLSPTHNSTLGSLLARVTAMPVHEARDGEEIESNHVYVIPPGQYLTAVDGKLRLDTMAVPRGRRHTVDTFFRTLADTHGSHAIAIVLSGADSDGAVGMKRIKEHGGLTIVQDPNEAEHSGMPRSAIATGMADWVLKTTDMPQRILDYLETERRLKLPPEEGPPLPSVERPKEDQEAALRDVLFFLRTRTGRDFSVYKRATILRRIARRMQVNGVDDVPAYFSFLRTHPDEATALLQDLLISVTNFFRDKEAFEALEHDVVPSLFAGKQGSDAVRVWVPACATGEEAYSIAMVLLEHAQKLASPPAIQVFGCDLNEAAIQVARVGYYSEAIAADVTDERLRRFFVRDPSGYRVRRELRETILFTTHDMLKDAPFSRMDLISCRNFLIYLGREAQQRVYEIFHFALRPGGKLFIGTSEAIDETNALFRPFDKKHRIYVQQPGPRGTMTVPLGQSTVMRAAQTEEREGVVRAPLHGKALAASSASSFGRELDRVELAELHFKLLERYSPPSLLVNGAHDVVHLSASAGRFLHLTGGEPRLSLLHIVDPELRADLRAALYRATEAGTAISTAPISIGVGGDKRAVIVRVTPTPEIAPGHVLVVFETHPAALAETVQGGTAPSDTVVRYLERELEQVKAVLRNTIEQDEASTEELKASNEELQAMNEELHSATEELETSREELQSINEELTTVNQEMKWKMDELATANSDLQNLMASTSIATVFLDRQLTIMRYTPSAVDIFNLIPGDVGRPLAHLKHKLDYPDLIADAGKVRETLASIERTVFDGTRWFLVRMQPYRTVEDHIAGVVLTLVDVTERNRATEALRLSEERLRLIIESAREYAIFTLDPERRIESWSSGAEAVFGYGTREIVGKLADVLYSSDDRAAKLPERELERASREGRAGGEHWYARKDGSTFFGSGSMMPLRERGVVQGYVTIMRDLTAGKRSDEALHEHVEELTRFNTAAIGRETRMVELKREINELASRLGQPARYPIPERE